MQIKDKTILITGGSDGLGLEITKSLMNTGGDVHILARGEEKLAKVKEEYPKITTHQADVTDYNKLAKAVEEIGNIDILINNAGMWLEGELVDNDIESISKTIDVNLKGTIFMTKAVLPNMLKKGDGLILNISSTSGLRGRDSQSVYAASKFGVQGFTESLKVDLANTNIKVVGFYPGGMSTEFFNKSGNEKDNSDWMSPQKVANVVKFIIEQDDSMIIDHIVVNKRKTKTSN